MDRDALDGDRLWAQPYEEWPRRRIYEFDQSRGVTGFPDEPAGVHHQPPGGAQTLAD